MKKRYIVLALAVLLAAVFGIGVLASADDWPSPFKSKAEEEAAIKAAEIFDMEQEKEIRAQKEFEANLTDEERAAMEESAKKAEEEIYLQKKAAAEVRYAELEKLLADFKATHDLDNLTEEENLELIAIQDEMLDLYGPYIAPQVETTAEDYLKQVLYDDVLLEIQLDGLQEALEKYTRNGNEELVKSCQSEINKVSAKLDYIREMVKRYEAGEDPELLQKEVQEWHREWNARIDW